MKTMISLAAIPVVLAKPYVRSFVRDGIAAKTIKKFQPVGAMNTKSKVPRKANPYRLYIPIDGKHAIPEKVEAPKSIVEAVGAAGYVVEDYISGIAASPDGKKRIRIGKLIKDNLELADIFKKDPVRNVSKSEAMCVISCHPYDIAGMSTGRHWTSCMNLDEGMYSEFVIQDVLGSTLIAYAVSPNDTNIENPKSRFLIKLATARDNPDETVYIMESSQYGAAVPGFVKTLELWLKKVNQGMKHGVYNISKELYDDGLSNRFVHLPSVADVEESERLPMLETLQVEDSMIPSIIGTDPAWFSYLGKLKLKEGPEAGELRDFFNALMVHGIKARAIGKFIDGHSELGDKTVERLVKLYGRASQSLPKGLSLNDFLRTSKRMSAFVESEFGYEAHPNRMIKFSEIKAFYSFDPRWIQKLEFANASDSDLAYFYGDIFEQAYQLPIPFDPVDTEVGRSVRETIEFLVSFYTQWVIPVPPKYKDGIDKLSALGLGRSTKAADNNFDDLLNYGGFKLLCSGASRQSSAQVFAAFLECDLEWARQMNIYFADIPQQVLAPLIPQLLKFQADGLNGESSIAFNLIRASSKWTRIFKRRHKDDLLAAIDQAKKHANKDRLEYLEHSREEILLASRGVPVEVD